MDALAAFALTGVAHGLSAAVMGALVIGEAVILVAAFIAARLARTLEIAGIGPFEITARIVPAAAEIIVATVSGPVALIELVALAVPIIATVLAVLVAAIVLTLVVPVLNFLIYFSGISYLYGICNRVHCMGRILQLL